MTDIDLGTISLRIEIADNEPVAIEITKPDGTIEVVPFDERGVVEMRPHFLTLLAGSRAPSITSASTASVTESSTLAHSLTANAAVTWSIVGGADQAQFELSGSTLRWVSNGTKDFEAPDDADTNNTYIVTVRATKTANGLTADQTITVTVTDVVDTDEHIASVVLLTHFTGSDGSTSFTDSSPTTPHTLTANGNAQITSNKLELDGTGDFVSAPDNADWLFSGDFTIEIFGVEFDDLDANQTLVSQWETTINMRSWLLSFNGSTDVLSGNATLDGSNTVAATHTWSDIAAASTAYNVTFERSGTTLRLYINGTKVGTNGTLSANNALHNSTTSMRIGANNSGSSTVNFLNGRMSAIRITKGVARYATDTSYTVPSLPLPTE